MAESRTRVAVGGEGSEIHKVKLVPERKCLRKKKDKNKKPSIDADMSERYKS